MGVDPQKSRGTGSRPEWVIFPFLPFPPSLPLPSPTALSGKNPAARSHAKSSRLLLIMVYPFQTFVKIHPATLSDIRHNKRTKAKHNLADNKLKLYTVRSTPHSMADAGYWRTREGPKPKTQNIDRRFMGKSSNRGVSWVVCPQNIMLPILTAENICKRQ